jgi:hypothetical protein
LAKAGDKHQVALHDAHVKYRLKFKPYSPSELVGSEFADAIVPMLQDVDTLHFGRLHKTLKFAQRRARESISA